MLIRKMKWVKIEMKKIIATMLAIVMSLGFGTSAFAAENVKTTSNLTDSTIITDNNVYEVAEYLDLGANAVVKNDNKMYSTKKVMIGDLKKVIAQANYTKTLIDINDDRQILNNSLREDSVSGTKTVYYSTNVGNSIPATYSVTGTYYSTSYTRYWKTVTGSSISVDPTYAPYFFKIDNIHKQDATVVNAYRSNSYIKLEYNYDVGAYLGVDDLSIRYWQDNINGYTNFYGQDYI